MFTDKIAATHLGKKSLGSEIYSPELLVAIPRYENRKQYNIKDEELPFEGYDIWHAYEFSSMTASGIPVTRVIKIKYSCNSKFLVESKSLKLYLNSFNMTRFGKSIKECLKICQDKIQKDLIEKLQTKVQVNFLENDSEKVEIFPEFKNIIDLINENEIKIDIFKENPSVLKFNSTEMLREYYLTFDSLRSNCRVTHQPDFGEVFIYYKSKKHISEDSLVKYLTSFRSEFHFHEECCEMIYKRLYDLLDKDDELFVGALYTRRGGIDISPTRWSNTCKYKGFNDLIDISKYARCGIKQ